MEKLNYPTSFIVTLDKHENSENKKEKRKARKEFSEFLKELKKARDAYDKIKDINEKISKLGSLITKYGRFLPPNVRTRLENATQFTDTSPEGILNTLKALQEAVQHAIKFLPAPIAPVALVGIGIAITVVTTYIALVGSLDVTNDGCQIISAVGQFTPIPSIADGETKKIIVPKIPFNISHTTHEITFSSQLGTVPIPLPDNVNSLTLDGNIVGANYPVNFGDGIEHHMIITCKR